MHPTYSYYNRLSGLVYWVCFIFTTLTEKRKKKSWSKIYSFLNIVYSLTKGKIIIRSNETTKNHKERTRSLDSVPSSFPVSIGVTRIFCNSNGGHNPPCETQILHLLHGKKMLVFYCFFIWCQSSRATVQYHFYQSENPAFT